MLRSALVTTSSRGGLRGVLGALQQGPWLGTSQASPSWDQSLDKAGCWKTGQGFQGSSWHAPWAEVYGRGFHSSRPAASEETGGAADAGAAAEVVAHQPAEVADAGALIEFTPDMSTVGGSLIGLAAASKLSFTGRILGVSGILRGVISGDTASWRYFWLAGVASGAMAMTYIYPAAFPTLPDSYSLLRAAGAGLLVGLGTSLGSGCTSGHGICGLARMAPRSLAAVCTFMASGALVAGASGTLAACGVDVGSTTTLALMSPEQWKLAGSVVAGSLATLGTLRMLPSLGVSKHAAAQGSESATGFVFALGLGLSGMLQPAKVAGFLSPLLPAWDPSLAFVMGGALAITLPTFQFIKRRRATPLLLSSFSLPTSTKIDKPLLLGSLMFGAGWGLGGVCPGPGLVSLAQPTPQIATLVAAMCVGMYLHRHLLPFYDRVLGDGTSIAKKVEEKPDLTVAPPS